MILNTYQFHYKCFGRSLCVTIYGRQMTMKINLLPGVNMLCNYQPYKEYYMYYDICTLQNYK